MSLLQTLKSAVIRLNGDRNPIFDVPVARQKAFLESLPEPKDLLDRSYAQYRCQMMLERPILRVMYQAAARLSETAAAPSRSAEDADGGCCISVWGL